MQSNHSCCGYSSSCCFLLLVLLLLILLVSIGREESTASIVQVTLIEGKSLHEATWWHDIFVSYFFLVLENGVGRSSYSVFQSSKLNMLIPAFVSLFQVVLIHELFLQHFNLKTRPSFIS